MEKHFVYILLCSDSTLYTGWTTDLENRIKAHNSGNGAKYTRSRLPVELVYYEEFETPNEAQKREYQIKHLTREEKLELIKKAEPINVQALFFIPVSTFYKARRTDRFC